MIFWFFTAAMIESFNIWRWNYGPYKEPVNHAGHSGKFFPLQILEKLSNFWKFQFRVVDLARLWKTHQSFWNRCPDQF